MNLRHIFRLRTAIAFFASGVGTFLFSIILETFLFRPLVKASPDLFPWNRELNAISMILAATIGGALAVLIARRFSLWTLTRDEEQHPEWLLVAAAAGAAALVWLLRHVAPDNPLTVGWRGIVMSAAGAATGGSLLVGGRSRAVCGAALLVTLLLGFGTVSYDTYAYDITIPSRRALLRGEVIVPGRHADATYPGVLLFHDQGALDRDGTRGMSTPYRDIAEHLALNGYAVLRFDKRGTGESSGVFTQISLDEFVQDASRAATVFSAQSEVRDQPLYVVAHGFGGYVAALAAQHSPELFDGVVLLNAPSSPIEDLLVDQEQFAMETSGASESETQNHIDAIVDWIEGVRSRRYLNYGDYFGRNGISEDLQTRQRSEPTPPAWLGQALEHDQAATVARLPHSLLLVAGSADWRVPPSEAESLADALASARRSDWELQVLEGVGHDLAAVEDRVQGFLREQGNAHLLERHPVAPEVLDVLLDWLDRQQ